MVKWTVARHVLLPLLAAAVAASGCTSLMAERDRLLMSGRFGELQRHVEQEIAQAPTVKTAKLYPLCWAYYNVKNYRKLFPCLERLEAVIQTGDRAIYDLDELAERSPGAFALVKMGGALTGGDDDVKGDATAVPHLLRAYAYTELGDYPRAHAEAKKAYDRRPTIWNHERGFRIWALGALGLSYALAGDRENGRKWAEALEDVGTMYPYNLLAPEKNFWLTKIYLALGDHPTALKTSRRGRFSPFSALALAVGSVTAGENLFAWQELPRKFVKTKVELENGHLTEAKEGYDELLAHAHTRENGEIYWLILFDRGRIAAAEGRLAEAIGFYRQAVDVIEQQRATINTEANKIGFVGDKQAVYQRLVAALIESEQHAAAFEYVERSKARALVDLLATKHDFAVERSETRRVQALLDQMRTSEDAGRIQDETKLPEVAKTRTLAVTAISRLREEAPELASLVTVTPIAADDIRRRLPADEALVEYYDDGRALYAFVVAGDDVRAIKLDGTGLADDIRRFRELLQQPTSEPLPMSRRLYERLVRPIATRLDRPNLLVVPHGPLHYLPFAALHGGEEYLLDRHALRVLPSASVLAYLKSKPVATPALLAFGNPDLRDARLDLTFAEGEVVAIGRALPDSKVLVRRQATETAFKEFAGAFTHLHFATHGQFNAEAPLRSALLLAGDEANDGVLTVSELYSLRLDAELVTLSACETGLGKLQNGDDVVGLTRGFLYAGARSIVASLWQVDDQATSVLMTHFYGRLAMPKRAALREAQLAIRARYPHPYYWAAFQLTGLAE